MSLLAVGISHRTAPVALLEQFAMGRDDTVKALHELVENEHVSEAIVLATCNRVEVFAEVERFHGGVSEISRVLARQAGSSVEELSPYVTVHYEDQAVAHLFTVAAGLDSMVVGETQVLGQLRAAYALAQEEGAVGRALHPVAQRALRVGKRVHSETGIDAAGQSLVSVGLDQATRVLDSLEGRNVLVVGAGSMGALAGTTLRRAGVGGIVVANRTPANAERLARSLGGRGVGLEDLAGEIAAADVVVTSTGAIGLVVTRDAVADAVAQRDGRPLVVLDLALPHDVDPAVRHLPGVTLVDLASLQSALAGTDAGDGVEAARRIVAEEVGSFLTWQLASKVQPTVVALRGRADEVVAAELTRLSNRLPELDDTVRAELEQTVRRVVQSLLHTPTVRVKELVDSPVGLSYGEALRELFGLDRDAPAAVGQTPLTMEEDQ